jgi:hypothetical protein
VILQSKKESIKKKLQQKIFSKNPGAKYRLLPKIFIGAISIRTTDKNNKIFSNKKN